MKKSIKYLFFTIFPLSILNAQPDLSGTVTFPDSVGIDLIRVEVWQNNQQITSTITDSLGYFEIDSIVTGVNNISNPVPSSFELYPNYPSPFDKTTNIIYEVNEPEEISITIYNSIGQKITTLTSGYRQKGFYVAQWNGRNNFGNEVAQGVYFARLDNGKDAKYIKLLKINGALNAIGTSISGSFYSSYKGSTINEDYLVKFIDINIFNRVDYTEITVSLPAQIHQVLYEEFSYTGPSQIVGDEGEKIAVAKSWFNYGTQLDTIELINTNTWYFINSTSDSLYFATIDTCLNGQIPLELKTTALHSTADTTELNINLTAETYLVYGFVTTPNGMPLDSVDVAAYDTLGNFLNREITVQDGSFAVDSIAAVTIDLIFNDLKNRTDTETLRVMIPAEVNKILQETYAGYQGGNLQGREGEEIGIAKADFPYNNGLDTLILLNTGTWHHTRSTLDSIYYKTNNPNANGNILLQLIAQATGGTQNQEDIMTNLTDMVTLTGGIYDNDDYLKLEDGSTGPPIAGYVKESETGQKIYTSNGLFTLRIPATSNATLKAQHIIGLDTLSFESNHDIDASQDLTDIILHPVTSYGMEPGQMPLFKLFYFLVNDRTGHFNYSGKKYIDKNPLTHRVVIPLINDLGDTMTVADQDSVENFFLMTYFNGMQNPPPIIKLGLNDPTPIGEGGGQWIIFMRDTGPYSGSAVDFNNDGIIDEAYIKISKLGGPTFFLPDVLEETFTGEAGPNNLNDSRLRNITVLEGGSSSNNLFTFDNKLRHLGENYPPKEVLERILGNIQMINP